VSDPSGPTSAKAGTHHGFLKAMLSATGVSIAAQLLAFLRQIMTAAYFGVARELDIYFMTYAIATIMVLSFGPVLDSVGIPHLVRMREEKGEAPFRELAGSLVAFSIVLAFALSALFIAGTPLVAQFMAAGFPETDRQKITSMATFFLPWTFIALPYYALCSVFKSVHQFSLVFTGEVVIALASVLFLLLHHSTVTAIPLSYFAGYVCALTLLLVYAAGRFRLWGSLRTDAMKGVTRNFFELFGANQLSSLASVIERFFQSYLPAGGISALNYSSQMTVAATSVLTFREIFMVPLSSADRRAEKLERLVIAITVVVVPVMIFIAAYAGDIVAVLFERGRFDQSAKAATADTLSVYALVLLPSTAGLPVFRMFQVIDRIRMTAVVYLLGALNFAVFGSIFMFGARMGTPGMALTVVVNSYLSVLVSLVLLRKCGVITNWVRMSVYGVYTVLISLVAIGLIKILPLAASHNPVIALFVSGCLFSIFVLLGYLPLWSRLKQVIRND
jgi:putative peptidoglycan lipid II flippase